MESFNLVGLLIFISSLFLFVYNMFHLLNLLLVMEILSLSLLVILMGWVSLAGLEFFSFLLFLLLVVSESVVGLGVLVALSRTHGSESLGLSEMMKW